MTHFQRIVLAGLLALTSVAPAQEWPSRPIRVIIPSVPGGPSDVIFRVLAPALESALGQRFVLEFKPGASQNIGTAEVTRAAPDGYTFLLAPTGVYAINPHLFKNLRFDPLTALDPVTVIAEAPVLLVVGASVPANTLKELAEYVRANPGKLNYGSPASGTVTHLAGAMFSQLTGNALVHIPYKGSGPMLQALIANEIQVMFPSLTVVQGSIRSGRLKVIAVAAKERIADLPEVPTSAEAGFPGLIAGNAWVLAGPRGTGAHIVGKLAGSSRNALNDPGLRKRIHELGHSPVGLTPTETAAFLQTESARYKTIIERAGIKADD